MRPRNDAIAAMIATLLAGPAAAEDKADPPAPDPKAHLDTVCTLIRDSADTHGLPRDFLARLIWKESRFDAEAVSPVGAEGIAQFMPGTAKQRGLADSFDMTQAIPASAAYLAEMKTTYGNLGRAAIGYNAGEGRLNRWIAKGGFLPLETEDYVLSILGEPADNFADATHAATIRPLDEKLGFDAACRKLPVIAAATIPMARVHTLPWGVQVAGNFRRSAAIRQWQRLQGRFASLLKGHKPVVSRVRTPIGRRGIYAVRIGADKRANAELICRKLRAAGGSCLVMRNR
ncbi:lytic transglycosylase [Zhengella mangrovi]|uniref:Lytic transglycosylase n=2 Tax=Zhengella mangrovi TaxID=1982044 RepID=A0A2G1QKS1_9HYPH|nr:lytic transglycosylase domain-containing protein [Zhengella mangrovi]PHP66064.1 lytic transglycosylase [Zhengella mangrovi]